MKLRTLELRKAQYFEGMPQVCLLSAVSEGRRSYHQRDRWPTAVPLSSLKRGEKEADRKLREKAAEQSYCTGRRRAMNCLRRLTGRCLRECQQLVEGAPVSSVPFCGESTNC
jgi:hypothetical protein